MYDIDGTNTRELGPSPAATVPRNDARHAPEWDAPRAPTQRTVRAAALRPRPRPRAGWSPNAAASRSDRAPRRHGPLLVGKIGAAGSAPYGARPSAASTSARRSSTES